MSTIILIFVLIIGTLFAFLITNYSSETNKSDNSPLYYYLLGPLIISILAIKSNTSFYPFFKTGKFLMKLTGNTILYYIPNIVFNHPYIFIYITFNVILLLCIVTYNYYNQDSKVWSKFFSILINNKLSINYKFLYFINIIKFNYINKVVLMYRNFVNNSLSFFFIMLLIMILVNIFRQPFIIILGQDILSDVFLYYFMAISTLLPVNFAINILKKKFRTNKWDFSFKFNDYNNITYLYLFFFTIYIYISYYYILPALSSLSLLLSVNIMHEYYIKHINYNNIPKSINNTTSLRAVMPGAIILPALSFIELLDHLNISHFTARQVLSSIDRVMPPADINYNGITYLPNFNAMKSQIANNLRHNMRLSALHINVPRLDNFISSYLNNPHIRQKLINLGLRDGNPHMLDQHLNVITRNFRLSVVDVHASRDVVELMAWHYFNRNGYEVITQENFFHKFMSHTPNKLNHCVIITPNSHNSFIKSFTDLHHSVNHNEDVVANRACPFIIFTHDRYITFAEYRPDYHQDPLYTLKAGDSINLPNFKGIIGLILTQWGIQAVPQQNIYSPQLAWYDFTNSYHRTAIHAIFEYFAMNPDLPQRDIHLSPINVDDRIETDLTIFNQHGHDNLGLKIKQSGRLTRYGQD